MRLLAIILSILICAIAKSNEQIPAYCALYPNISKTVNSKNMDTPSKTLTSLACMSDQSSSNEVYKLSRLVENAQEKYTSQITQQFERRLQKIALEKILDVQEKYADLFQNVNQPKKNSFQKCFDKKSRQKDFFKTQINSFDPSKQKRMIQINIINAIKAQALFEEKKNHDKTLAHIGRQAVQKNNICRQEKIRCRKKTSLIKNTKHCSLREKKCLEQNQKMKENQYNLIKEKIGPLYSMVQSSPLLFAQSNEGRVIGPFLRAKLSPSRFLNKIVQNLPKELIHEMKVAIDSKDSNALSKYFARNESLINNLFENKKVYNNLLIEAKKAIRKKIKSLNHAISEICKGKGKDLHLYPFLVQEALKEIESQGEKQQIIASQIAYCHLLRKKPSHHKVSLASISGFALLGIGATLQIIPIAGNVSGSVLFVMGGSLLTAKGYKDYSNSNKAYKQEKGLHSAGFLEYERLLSSQRLRDKNLSLSIINTAILPFDIIGLRILKQAKEISKNTPQLTKDIKVSSNGNSTKLNDKDNKIVQNQTREDAMTPANHALYHQKAGHYDKAISLYHKQGRSDLARKLEQRRLFLSHDLNVNRSSSLKGHQVLPVDSKRKNYILNDIGKRDYRPGTHLTLTYEDGTKAIQHIDSFDHYPKEMKKILRSLQLKSRVHSDIPLRYREYGAVVFETVNSKFHSFKHTSNRFGSISVEDLKKSLTASRPNNGDPLIKGRSNDDIVKVYYVHTHPNPAHAREYLGLEADDFLSSADIKISNDMKKYFRHYLKRQNLKMDSLVLPGCLNCKNILFRYHVD